MAIPILGPVLDLGNTLIKGVSTHFQNRQKIKAAVADRNAEKARDQQNHDHDWELRSLDNAGWKDEVLFIAILSMYVFSAFNPDAAAKVFTTWDTVIPEWYQQITFWLVGSVLGVKKIGEYLPGAISGIKKALKS